MRSFWDTLRRLTSPSAPGRPWRRPRLETLEDRCVPSTIDTWIGPNGGKWSVGANWSTGVAPNDNNGTVWTVQFGSTFGGTNTNSVDDIGTPNPFSLYNLTMDGTYTGTLTLDDSLFVANTFNWYSGTINTLDSNEHLELNATNWYGGEDVGPGPIDNGGLFQTDGTSPMYIGTSFNNRGFNFKGHITYGVFEWGNQGIGPQLVMANNSVFTNGDYGIFEIGCDSILRDDFTNCYIVNDYGGTIGKGSTSGTTNIEVGQSTPNINYGTINANSGTLVFTAGPQFINEGLINDASTSGGITFDIPFVQQPSTQEPNLPPAFQLGNPNTTASFVASAPYSASINAGSMSATYPGGTISTTSKLVIQSGGQLSVGASSGTATVTTNGNELDDSGVAQLGQNGTVSFSSFYVQSGGTLNVVGPNNVMNGEVFNNGVVNVGPGGSAHAAVTVNGDFTNYATTNVSVPTPPQGGGNDGIAVDAGLGSGTFLNQGSGAVVNMGALSGISAQGQIDNNATLDVIGAATQTAGGAFLTGTVINNGLIEYASAYELLAIAGNYTQYNTLDEQLASSTQTGIVSSDLLSVSGTATFMTGAVINVAGPPSAILGQCWEVVGCNSIVGANTLTVNLPPPGNGYKYTWAIVTPPPSPPLNLPPGLWVFTSTPG